MSKDSITLCADNVKIDFKSTSELKKFTSGVAAIQRATGLEFRDCVLCFVKSEKLMATMRKVK